MAHEYLVLTDDEKKSILENRLRQFETEHFNHELNKLNVEALPDEEVKTEQLAQIDQAQATIQTAIDTTVTELDKLNTESPPEA
jgi:hypothetical protein